MAYNNNNFANQNNNQINNNEIMELARLSCLELTTAEQENLSEALSRTMEHFSVISSLSSDSGEPGGLPVEKIVSVEELRSDEPKTWSNDSLHSAAPDFEETYYFVPKVL